MGDYTANSPHCALRNKAGIRTRKENKANEIQKKNEMASDKGIEVGKEEREAGPQLKTNIELGGKNWAPSPTTALEYEVDESLNEIPEGRNYTEDY